LERTITLAETNQADLTVVDVVEHVETKELGSAYTDLQSALVSASGHALKTLVDPYRTNGTQTGL